MTREIVVIDVVPRILTLENTVVELFNIINKTSDKEVILDFKGVEFMNVAFAQKYNELKRECKKNISEINLGEYESLMSVAINLFEY